MHPLPLLAAKAARRPNPPPPPCLQALNNFFTFRPLVLIWPAPAPMVYLRCKKMKTMSMNTVAQLDQRRSSAPALLFPLEPRHQPRQIWRVAIVHQDPSSLAWGKQVTDLLAQHLPPQDIHLATRNINLLDSAVYSQSIPSMAKADLIVVALHDPNRLPSEFYLWTNLWLDVRARRPGALVALLDASQGHTPDFLETRSYLHAVAEQGGLDIIVTEYTGMNAEPRLPQNPQVLRHVVLRHRQAF